MTNSPLTGAAVGILCLGALLMPSTARADQAATTRVCSPDTQQQRLVSRRGEPASERVLQLVEGNLKLFAVDIALDAPLSAEVTEQQIAIMRAVAGELGMAAEPEAEPQQAAALADRPSAE